MRKDADGVMRPIRIPQHIDIVAAMSIGAQLHLQVSTVAGLVDGPEAFIFGSTGTLRFANNSLYGGQKEDDALNEIPIPAEEEGGWRVEEEFISAIRGNEVITHTNFEDGVKVYGVHRSRYAQHDNR